MGTWGIGPFENDSAMDFLSAIEDANDASSENPSALIDALRAALEDPEEEEAIVAAAIVVAVAFNRMESPSGDGDDSSFGDNDESMKRLSGIIHDARPSLVQNPELVDLARKGVAYVMDERPNLYLCWEEAGSEEFNVWKRDMEALRASLA